MLRCAPGCRAAIAPCYTGMRLALSRWRTAPARPPAWRIWLQRGPGAGSFATNWSAAGTTERWGDWGPWKVDPWFLVANDTAGLEVLARYASSGAAAVVRQYFPATNHSAVFAGAPGMPAPVMRALAADAGVHLYLEHGDDVVDGRGNCLMLHAGPSHHDRRVVRLPRTVRAVTMHDASSPEPTSVPCEDGDCAQFSTPDRLAPGATRLFCFDEPTERT